MILTNQIFVIWLGVILLFVGLFVALGLYLETLLAISFWLASFACMLANKLGWSNVSRVGLSICCCVTIVFFASMLGEAAGFQYIMFPVISFPLVCFEARERGQIVLCIAVVVASLFLVDLSDYALAPRSSLTLTAQRGIYLLMVLSTFTLTLGPTLLFFIASHRAEARLIRANAELQRTNDQLNRTRGEALRADHAKTSFVANMSHELRTPLNAIIGYAELLRDELGDKGVATASVDLERIRGAGEYLLNIINNVLDWSMIEAGRISIFPETFALGDFVDEIAAAIRPGVKAQRNRLHLVRPPGQLGLVRVDRARLRQALLNLLQNACKFTEAGRVEFAVSREAGRAGDVTDEWMVFYISDSGIGISPEFIPELFQPFSRGRVQSSGKHEGTGLGLALSQRLVRRMGGNITVKSSPGKGSTFIVRIPLTPPWQD